MRTDFQTQLPFEITRVQGASTANAVGRDNMSTSSVAGATGSTNSQNVINEKKAVELEREIKSINEDFKSANIELQFTRDDRTGIVVLKLVDSATGDALRQIPSEVSLRLADAFGKLRINLFSSEV